MAALLLNACNHPGENKTADGNNSDDGVPSRPQPKFAVTYAGVYALTTVRRHLSIWAAVMMEARWRRPIR